MDQTEPQLKHEFENEPVPTVEELLAKADAIGTELRDLIVETKRLPKSNGLAPHQDPVRALSQAQVNLQSGFMWLRKAIEQPKEF